MEEHLIDVRDVDGEYFERVWVWLDRAADRYHLPLESVERLGEPDDENNYLLLDGSLVAERDEAEVGGRRTTTWSVPVTRLTTRPARQRR